MEPVWQTDLVGLSGLIDCLKSLASSGPCLHGGGSPRHRARFQVKGNPIKSNGGGRGIRPRGKDKNKNVR